MPTFFLFPIVLTCLFMVASSLNVEARDPFIQGGGGGGFTLDLIHRDSPLSPLHNPSHTRLDAITNAFHRSVARAKPKKRKNPSKIESQIYSIPGEYIMKIAVGTPPVETLGIADTGSDLTWTQCNPCNNCFKQTTPIFTPSKSSSYKPLSCQSKPCSAMSDYGSSCSSQNQCQYRMSYGDHSYTEGDLSSETFTFSSCTGKSISIKNIAFGCGHNNGGTFNETISGIIGLGGGPLSIVKQLHSTTQGKFSYCLVPIYKGSNLTSQIHFGDRAVVSGPGVVSTPLVTKQPDTFYYLTLESVKIGNKSLAYKANSNIHNTDDDDGGDGGVNGNIIIDSGTTLTMLPRDFYTSLESELVDAMGAGTAIDPQGLFSLCYNSMDGLNVPTITVSFAGGADLELPPTSTFLEIQEGLVCLTMIPSHDLAIFGNLSQENFLIGYDLVNNQISFKPTDCTRAQ